MNKKIIDIINEKNIYKFKFCADKYGNDLIEIIKFYNNDRNLAYNIYFEILSELWKVSKDSLKSVDDLWNYLESKIKRKTSEPVKDHALFENKEDFLELEEKGISEKARDNRYMLYLNEIVVEEILLDEFKKEIPEVDVEFEEILSCRKRIPTIKGFIYDNKVNEDYIILYLITKKFIYEKPFNIKYEEILNDIVYKKYIIEEIETISEENKDIVVIFKTDEKIRLRESNLKRQKILEEYLTSRLEEEM